MLHEIAEIYIDNVNLYPDSGNAEIYQLCWYYLLGTAKNNEIEILKKYFLIC